MNLKCILLVAGSVGTLVSSLVGQTATTPPVGVWAYPFPPGTYLAGQSETNGATWQNAGPAGPAITIAADSLAVPGLAVPSGNRARLAGVDGPAARIPLGTNLTGGTLYYSLALRVADLGTLGPNGGTLVGFNNATGPSQNLPLPLAARLVVRSSQAGYQLGISAASGNTEDFIWWDWEFFTPNDTIFVVCSYTFVAGTGNDTVRLWVNPAPETFAQGTPPAPALTATASLDIDQLSSFVLMQRPQPILPAVTFVDEVRVGPTWASVTPPDPARAFFGGLLHTALGAANLFVSSNGLQVTGAGTSGTNGFSIDLGAAEGWQASVLPPLDPASAPDGSRLSWNLFGTVNGTPAQLVSGGRMEVAGGGINAYADFSAIGAAQYLVRAYSNNVLLASNVVPANALAYRFPGPGPGPIIIKWEKPIPDDEDPTCSGRWSQPCPVIINFPGGPVLNADRVTVTPVAANARVESFSKIDFLGAWSNGALVLRDESLQKSALFHSALGQARLFLSGTLDDESARITVSNIGTSGQDGVSTLLDHNHALSVHYDEPAGLRLGPGTAAHYRFVGPVVNNVAILGTIDFLNLTVRADFSTVGASSFLLEIWNGSQWVGSATVPGNVLGTINPQADGFITMDDWEAPFLTQPAFQATFRSPVVLTPTGGSPLVGDVLRITALTSGNFGPFTRIDQLWENLPELTFSILMRDFGDAPVGYPVTRAETGGSHSYAPNWRLGNKWDREFNGTHSAASDYDDTHGTADEMDGVIVTTAAGGIQVQVTAAVNAYLDAWIDLNRNLFWEPGERVANAVLLTAGVPRYFNIAVPPGTPAGSFNSRWRLSAAGGLTPAGYGGKGEVEDVTFNWQPETPLLMDFGDALEAGTTFPVTFARDGARHGASPLFMGLLWDSDADGLPSAGADLDDLTGSDDEDGVAFTGPFVAGSVTYVDIYCSAAGIIDAWVDWNNNLNWDAPEHCIAGFAAAPGWNHIPVAVPGGIPSGQRYARFRLSTAGSPAPAGYAVDGEVEDYYVTVAGNGGNNNPNPDLVLGSSESQFTATENLARNLTLKLTNSGSVTASNVHLEARAPIGLQVLSASSPLGSCQVTGGSNVVCSVPTLASNATLEVVLSLRPIFLPLSSSTSSNLGTLTASVTSLQPDFNPANNVVGIPVIVFVQTDWGDAHGGFPVTPPEGGAYHRYSPAGPWLGTRWDHDGVGNHSVLADWDDTHSGPDDEDGIVWLSPLYRGLPAVVQVTATASGYVDAWADFNNDGDWADPGEQILASQPVVAGPNLLTIYVPVTAVPAPITTRWRISTTGGLAFAGYGGFGEVEDHMVDVKAALGLTDLALAITPVAGGISLSWTNPAALLEEAIHVVGPYTTVPGATSPWFVPTGVVGKFYRLRLGSLPFEIPTTSQANFYGNANLLASVPAFGQPFYGQDAQFKHAPQSYTDNLDGTVTDNTTGLMWQQVPGGPVSWTKAVSDAATFTLAGYTDWRLPTIKELYSLFDARGIFGTSIANSKPFIDTNVFGFSYLTGAGMRWFDVQEWSSTEYVGTTMAGDATVFGVNFADGRIKGYPKFDHATASDTVHYVRYVRGNPAYGKNSFEDNGDGTVTDHATGLVWQKADSGVAMNWKDALAYATNLAVGGYSDWRLPTIKELQSIVDYTRAPLVTGTAAIDTNYFQVTETESYYWSSTTIIDGPPGANMDKAGYISFGQAFGYLENPPGSGSYTLYDVHGAGAQRADFKSGDPALYPHGFGPQGDVVRIFNYVRAVRGGLR